MKDKKPVFTWPMGREREGKSKIESISNMKLDFFSLARFGQSRKRAKKCEKKRERNRSLATVLKTRERERDAMIGIAIM